MAKIQNTDDSRHWQGCGATRTLIPCWLECKLTQPLWKTVRQVLTKLNIFYYAIQPSQSLILTQISWKLCLVAQLCPTLCDPMDCSTPGFPIHHQLLEFTQTHVHCISYAIQPSHPLSSLSPPTFNLSQHQGLLQWVSIRWPKYWSFSFSISSSNEYSGLISCKVDWLALLAVQGTLKSLL